MSEKPMEKNYMAEVKAEYFQRAEFLGCHYNPDSNLSSEDQLLICESVAEATPIKENYNDEEREINKNNISVNGNGNDSYKRNDGQESARSKFQIITELQECNYRTPPTKIASLLEELFVNFNSKPGHWLYVAQHWTPRAINRVIKIILKQKATGETTILNPARYFTFLIKLRVKRKRVRLPMIPVNNKETCTSGGEK